MNILAREDRPRCGGPWRRGARRRRGLLDCVPPAARRSGSSQRPSSMDEEETYMFDTQGYVILRDVLTASELATLNAGGC